jgi:RND family efflux transporter MFP subunit
MGITPLTRRGAALAAVAMLCVIGCSKEQPAKAAKNPRVVVTQPVSGTVIDYQDFTGRLDAIPTVDIRARVTGYVTDAPFKEGDFVKKGQLLYQIDKRPYEADLNQSQANLNLAIADRNLQEKNAERIKKALSSNSASREEYETVLATFEKSAASVSAAQAATDKAKLYLDYTAVTAPVTGRVSRRFVDPGNLVNADNSLLTTIVAEDPIYAYFDVDERTYLDLLGLIAPGQKSWSEGLKLPVMVRLANEAEFERAGVVDFVDNRVTATTGTVRMRGKFSNEKGRLTPGLFVRIRLPLGNAYKTLLIPDEAVQSDQERKYVWVVNAQNKVEYRSVQLGQAIQKLRVIRKPEKGKEGKEGVAEGEHVIVSGMQRVRNGVEVEVDAQPAPAAPDVPLVHMLAEKK